MQGHIDEELKKEQNRHANPEAQEQRNDKRHLSYQGMRAPMEEMHWQQDEKMRTGQQGTESREEHKKEISDRLNRMSEKIEASMPEPLTGERLRSFLGVELSAIAADDRSTGFFRFRRVKNAAAELNKAKTPEAEARAVASLFKASLQYLRKRKDTSYPDRKVLCESIVKKLPEYSVSCTAYQFGAIYEKIAEIRADTETVKKGRNKVEQTHHIYAPYLKEIEDRLREEYGTGIDEIQSEKEGYEEAEQLAKTDPEFASVRQGLESIALMRSFLLPKYIEPEEMEQKENRENKQENKPETKEEALEAFRDKLTGAGMMFNISYNRTIRNMDRYMKNKSLPIQHYFNRQKQSLKEELRVFQNVLTDCFYRPVNELSGKTWNEILTEQKQKEASISLKDAEELYGGTSHVYKVKNPIGRFEYYKKSEYMGRDDLQVWKQIFSAATKRPDYKQEYEMNLRTLDAAIGMDMRAMMKAFHSGEMGKYRTFQKSIYKALVSNRHQYGKERYFKALLANEEDPELEKLVKGESCRRTFSWLRQNGSLMDQKQQQFFANLLLDFTQNYNAYVIAVNSAGIERGSNLSVRNVATTRMADLLNLSGMVARSRTAKVSHNGETVEGNLMEEAKGTEAYGKKLPYSLKGMEELLIMSLFDQACGQVDRSTSNYFLQVKRIGDKTMADGVMMIDNDLSFGAYISGDALLNRNAKLPPFQKEAVLCLPKHVRQAFKEVTDLHIDLMLGDLLTEKELSACKDRFAMIRNTIDDAEKENELRKKGNDPWLRRHALAMESSDEYRMLFYQFRIYKKNYELNISRLDQQKKKEENKTKPGVPKMIEEVTLNRVSYISPAQLLSPGEIEKQMKEFLNRTAEKEGDPAGNGTITVPIPKELRLSEDQKEYEDKLADLKKRIAGQKPASNLNA